MSQITSYVEPFPHVIIDGLFNDAQYSEMVNEWSRLQSSALEPEHTFSARDHEGNVLKQNNGVMLDDVYNTHRDASPTLVHNRALFSPEITTALAATNPTFGLVGSSSVDKTLLSYYSDGDYYSIHYDYCTVTALTYWLPQGECFSGGILRFPDYGVEIPPKDNQTVLFVSCIRHEVTPLSGPSGVLRVTMSQFIGNWK
jgi:Rps23 Pro-64 3,4-dihydroxylase Tpa1-like proline 4-hydroxylase